MVDYLMLIVSKNGILLSTLLVLGVFSIILPTCVFAEEDIDVKSTAFETTTIIEFTNTGTKEIETFRMWLGNDFEFKSFKTEKGWTGQKTQQELIIFTSKEPLKPGETVKFGVKTDKPKPGLNWKTLDKNNEQLSIGKTLADDLEKYEDVVKTTETQTEEPTKIEKAIFDDSAFRIIPEKPSVGATIRVTGEKFGLSEKFDFYLNDKKVRDFESDEGGRFMMTTSIPDDQKAERVSFFVKDQYGFEQEVSVRLAEVESRVPEAEIIPLTISGLVDVLHRGEQLDISGTAQPGSAVTATVTNPNGKVTTTVAAEVDQKGNWILKEPIIIPVDAPFGKYTATITDGRETVLKNWSIESSKIVEIVPQRQKFLPGDLMIFNGTAVPNQQIEFALEDPVGKEIASSVEQTDQSGFVSFSYQTTQTSIKGTYALTITQGDEKELVYAGLGQLADIPVNLVFDKFNYKVTESPVITMTGQPNDIVSLLIIDPSSKQKGEVIPITLGPDASAKYTLDIEGYSTGVYTAVISKGNAKNSEIFSVGLAIGSGDISINTTKLEYSPGDSVLILGETGANVLLTVTLIDPDGNEVLEKPTNSDKLGKISEESIKIPIDAEAGMWNIRAQSGSNFDIIELEVTKQKEEGMVITIESITTIPSFGDVVNIKVIGAKQTVFIDILSEEGEIIDTITINASGSGEVKTPWPIPDDTPTGTYTVKSRDAFDSAETTFVIE